MPDQTAQSVTYELIKIFAVLGIPKILHSDQVQNLQGRLTAPLLSDPVGQGS